MTSNPWDKFFWNDYENDPALKLCSLSAQGLWMRCLCICAKADPKGYLVVAGRPLSALDIASLVGKPQPEVETLLTELASYGVYSTDRTGRIYSRRMVRDVKKARTAVENGRKGGNPSLYSERDNSASDNPRHKPQNPEAISQQPEKKEEFSLRSPEPASKPLLSKSRKRPVTAIPEAFPDTAAQQWSLKFWRDEGRVDLCGSVLREVEKFRDHAAKGDERYADWPAAWRNWCRNAVKFNKPTGLGGHNGGQSSHQSASASLSEAFRQRNPERGFFDGPGTEIVDAARIRDQDGIGEPAQITWRKSDAA